MKTVRSILLLQLIAILFTVSTVTAAVPEDQLELQIHEINDTNIDQMITTDSEWLIVLSAPWCSACKRFKKDFIQLKEKLEDEPLDRLVQLGSVNTDDNTNIASRFYLTYLPSIYHIKNRQVRLLDYGLPVLRHSQYANRDADSLYNFLKNNIYEKIDQWSYVFNPWSVFGVFLGFLGTLVGLLQKGVKAVAESSPYLSQAGVCDVVEMLIGLLGGVSSGKAQVAEYLEKNFGFKTFLMKNWKATYNNEDGMTADEVDEWMLGSSYWKDNWICYPITCKSDFDKLRRRPYFLSICVDAPLLVRYKRYIKKYKEMNSDVADENSKSSDNAPIYSVTPKRMAESLEEFIELDQRYAGDFHAIRFADIVIDNSGSLEQLHKNIESFTPEITSNLRTRLHWDDYFMLLSELAARRSNCMKRRVGCVLTKNNRVLATGYNGTPRGAVNCCDGGCKRCNNGARCGQSLQECLCMHAEENALLEVGRERISDGEATLYCNTCPCLSCAKKIAQCGVKKVVYHKSYGMDDMTKELFLQCGVILQQHTPISHLYLLNE